MTWLLSAFTVLLGFLTKSFADWFQHRYERDRDREARIEERRERLSEQRRAFQRETLLALQDAAMDLVHVTETVYEEDVQTYRETGRWQEPLQGEVEELPESHSVALRRTALLSVRVRDASVREMVGRLRSAVSRTVDGPTFETSSAAKQEMDDAFERLQPRIGELLRILDSEDMDDGQTKSRSAYA